MALVCPGCGRPSLRVRKRLELGPNAKWDENALQLVGCSVCSFRGVACYQESRRGALDDEVVHHHGWIVPQDEYRRLTQLMARCPKPGDRRCGCEAHRALRGACRELGAQYDESGCDTFVIRYVR